MSAEPEMTDEDFEEEEREVVPVLEMLHPVFSPGIERLLIPDHVQRVHVFLRTSGVWLNGNCRGNAPEGELPESGSWRRGGLLGKTIQALSDHTRTEVRVYLYSRKGGLMPDMPGRRKVMKPTTIFSPGWAPHLEEHRG